MKKICNIAAVLFFYFCLSGCAAQVDFFREHISAIDGDRCPMSPSCSTYAKQAMKKHGPLMGWIMACDRLMRCGRDELELSPIITKKGRVYCYDPLEANDFWLKKGGTQ